MPEGSGAARFGFARAVFAVAATYGYFLLFAEFAFLQQVRLVLGGEGSLRPVMAALGAGGIVGSALAAWRFSRASFGVRLAASYAACALAAAIVPVIASPACLAAVAWVIGASLGWNTVTLAAGLRGLFPRNRLGWGIGCGTGAAYAWCNVPALHLAPASVQCVASAVLAGLAVLAVAGLRPSWPEPAVPPRTGPGRWILIFLALVWLDSAAFYVIQQTPDLRGSTWSGEYRLWGLAAVHLAAALAAGGLLDRGRLGGTLGVAWAALASACLALGFPPLREAAGAPYAAGVSLYSTALVFFAARDGRPWVAAAVFALAGWVGSALGIGMALELRTVPVAFVAVSGLAVALGLRPARDAGLLALAMFIAGDLGATPGGDALVAQGRAVYIAEGCVHCHSQYVRPGVASDVLKWGPAHPLEEVLRGQPPLPGNRRQGPDLANVGNRRTPEWNRLHLQAPRTLSSGSRMPSYAHLFGPDDERGEALVAYLASLGGGTLAEHWNAALAWTPTAGGEAIAPGAAARLFQQDCAACHGAEGRGDGPLAGRVHPAPPDWSRDAWRRVAGGDEGELARLIKFGAPGTAMAGHESLGDAEILGLARHVKLLHK